MTTRVSLLQSCVNAKTHPLGLMLMTMIVFEVKAVSLNELTKATAAVLLFLERSEAAHKMLQGKFVLS